MPGTNLLVLFGLVFYLGASFLLWHLLLKEPRPRHRGPRRRRWPIRLAKTFATLIGGVASGAVTLLLVLTIVNAGKPGTMGQGVMLAVWGVAAVAAMLFIGRAPLIRRVVTRTCLALGVQGVLLPMATLISFLVAGTRLADTSGTGVERTVEFLGVRLAGNLPAVWVGLGGFCIGLVLVFVGDRARRRVISRRGVRGSRSSRARVLDARTRRQSGGGGR
jgi:hypothetical protein